MKPAGRGGSAAMKYHDGEIAVQTKAGVRHQAEKLAALIGGSLSPDRQGFVAAQRFAVLGTADWRGRVWASVVTGEAGFLQALDEQTIRIAAVPAAGDPLLENLARPAHAALIIPDLAARRRLRLNGRGQITDGAIEIRAERSTATARTTFRLARRSASTNGGRAPMRLPREQPSFQQNING